MHFCLYTVYLHKTINEHISMKEPQTIFLIITGGRYEFCINNNYLKCLSKHPTWKMCLQMQQRESICSASKSGFWGEKKSLLWYYFRNLCNEYVYYFLLYFSPKITKILCPPSSSKDESLTPPHLSRRLRPGCRAPGTLPRLHVGG